MQAGLETGGQEAVQYGARSEDEPEGESKGEPEGESEGEPEGGLFACNAAVVTLGFPFSTLCPVFERYIGSFIFDSSTQG